MLNYVELQELYYHNGSYRKKPLLCNVNEISNVQEDTTGYVDYVNIIMRNGKVYTVANKYSDVVRKILDASGMEDDLK